GAPECVAVGSPVRRVAAASGLGAPECVAVGSPARRTASGLGARECAAVGCPARRTAASGLGATECAAVSNSARRAAAASRPSVAAGHVPIRRSSSDAASSGGAASRPERTGSVAIRANNAAALRVSVRRSSVSARCRCAGAVERAWSCPTGRTSALGWAGAAAARRGRVRGAANSIRNGCAPASFVIFGADRARCGAAGRTSNRVCTFGFNWSNRESGYGSCCVRGQFGNSHKAHRSVAVDKRRRHRVAVDQRTKFRYEERGRRRGTAATTARTGCFGPGCNRIGAGR
ncbi:hypothetical protein APR09_006400, partial [Nocardia amikacinitolerans]|nr:hypothetical protein [Nocardia amikacinitolerans]